MVHLILVTGKINLVNPRGWPRPNSQSQLRIDHFSFGEPTSGLLYPLDGEKLIQTSEAEEFNYILNVVPTKLDTSKFRRTETYQYAVTQHSKKAPEAGIHFR